MLAWWNFEIEFLVSFWMNSQGDWYLKSDSLLRRMSLYNGLCAQSFIVFFEPSSLGLGCRFENTCSSEMLVKDQLLQCPTVTFCSLGVETAVQLQLLQAWCCKISVFALELLTIAQFSQKCMYLKINIRQGSSWLFIFLWTSSCIWFHPPVKEQTVYLLFTRIGEWDFFYCFMFQMEVVFDFSEHRLDCFPLSHVPKPLWHFFELELARLFPPPNFGRLL